MHSGKESTPHNSIYPGAALINAPALLGNISSFLIDSVTEN